MKALSLLARACSTFNDDPAYAKELFVQAMSCADSYECSQTIGNLCDSSPDEDMEFLSEAASKASRDMNLRRPK